MSKALMCIQSCYSKRGVFTSPGEASLSFQRGDDFKIVPEGPYFSIRDLEAIWADGFDSVQCYWSYRLDVPTSDALRTVILAVNTSKPDLSDLI